MALHHPAVFKMESSVKTHGRRQTRVASPEISMVSYLRYYVVSSLLSNLGVRGEGRVQLHVSYVGEREVHLIFLSFNPVRKITSCQSVLRNHRAPFF